MKTTTLATGKLFTDTYSKGTLETLSIGDYGKGENIKAQFLGRVKDVKGVSATTAMPLSEKWVITLSTQFGCPQSCNFCDVPKVGFLGNATYDDLMKQLYTAFKLNSETKYTDRLNIHYARMGEPMHNAKNVFAHATTLGSAEFKRAIIGEFGLRLETVHPVFTTMLPKSVSIDKTAERLSEWIRIKNDIYKGQAGLQLSINSTSNKQRNKMYNNECHSLEDIAYVCDLLDEPLGRKYCLNFALADDYEVDANRLSQLFDSNNFMVKITPIHKSDSAVDNDIKTELGYKEFTPYKKAEFDLIEAGFDVLIFIPSNDEEEELITCGNLALKTL